MNLAPTSHHPSGPSNFPMWSECIDFQSPPDVDLEDLDADEAEVDESAKARGTAKHRAVAMLFSGDLTTRQNALVGLSEREVDEVQWVVAKAIELIEANGYSASDIIVEQRVTLIGGQFEIIYFGTCDGECGPIDMDWKFGLQRNYFPQLAGYSLPKMEQRGETRRHAFTIYGHLKRVERYVITLDTARTVVFGLLNRRASPHRKPTPCQYCGWCAKKLTCPAIVATPVALVERRDDWALKLPSPHVSQLHDPAWVGAARFVWKRFLEPWGNAVEFASTTLAGNGITPAGFQRKPWSGKTSVTDMRKAFHALLDVVPEEVLWDEMGFSIGTLAKAYAAAAGIGEAKAKGIIMAKLTAAGVLTTEPSSYRLVAEKDAENIIRSALALTALPVSEIPEKGSDEKKASLSVPDSVLCVDQNPPEGARA